MIIREAVENDLSSIVNLLKQSLGDSTIPKSEGLWRWKHEENPFGSSYVILAEEDQEVIGLRAFMKWNWIWNDRSFKAIRAVDTATHPKHQGKGIFKKLTLKQIELCEQDGVDFVFNTPNEQSRPGYLKMGWVQQGKMPLKIKVTTPVSLALQILLKKAPTPASELISNSADWNKVISTFEGASPKKVNQIHTPYSSAYLRWRYSSNPLFPYSFISDYENYLLVYRLKEHSKYRELRITDFFLFKDSPSISKHIGGNLRKINRLYKTNAVTVSGNQFLEFRKQLKYLGMIPVRAFGPIVTLREVKKSTNMNELIQTNNWQYSLGDMELF